MGIGFDIFTTMKVVAFIPARYGSTRLRGKPLEKINGRPMIQGVYERVKGAGSVADVAVATDDERIAEAVRGFGGRVVMTSPDCATGTERVAEAAESPGAPWAGDADIVVNVQGDEPLIPPALIDDCVAPLLSDPSVGLSTPVVRIAEAGELADPNVVKAVAGMDGFALYFSRSVIPHTDRKDPFGAGQPSGAVLFYKHVGLYVYRRDVLLRLASLSPTPLERAERLEQLRALENGIRIKLVETTYNPVAVDTPGDLARVRTLVED